MIDLFVNGLRLNFDEFNSYQGKRRRISISYLLIMILIVSTIILFSNFSQIKFEEFTNLMDSSELQVVNDEIKNKTGEIENFNKMSNQSGISIKKGYLTISRVGDFSISLIRNISNSSEKYISMNELIRVSLGQIKILSFVTLYLKTLPFIFVSFFSIFILSKTLKKNVISKELSSAAALEICASLITLPVLGYLVLKISGMRDAMAIFIFLVVFILLVFVCSRELNQKNNFDKENLNDGKE